MRRADLILDWVRGPAVLDIGCAAVMCSGDRPAHSGPWWLHGRLLERFPTVVGIDSSPAAVSHLHESGFEEVVLADAQDFNLGRVFDTIVAGEVIEHLENPAGLLRSAARHLRAGGRLILTTPYPFSLMHVAYATVKYPKTCPNEDHVAWFCPSTLRELAVRGGYEVEHWQVIEDYEPSFGSGAYRLFARSVPVLRRILPDRLLGNSMLFVLRTPPGDTVES